MPALMELQAQYDQAGLQVIGIALDDVQSVRKFVVKLGIDYPILVGDLDVMQTNREYGNKTGMRPYIVLLDKQDSSAGNMLVKLNRMKFPVCCLI